jgi:hypothetical protein
MPTPKVITEAEDFPIKPSDINAAEYMWDSFDNMETDISAGWIIRLLQEKGNEWVPFTYGELNAYYRKNCKAQNVGNYTFNHLLGEFAVCKRGKRYFERMDVVVREGDEKNTGQNIQDTDVFRVTNQFVFRAYASRPIPRMKPVLQAQ